MRLRDRVGRARSVTRIVASLARARMDRVLHGRAVRRAV